jgi:hypothetical protein
MESYLAGPADNHKQKEGFELTAYMVLVVGDLQG